MLSILKNKENIATQILNQFDVDYDIFKNELGFVTSNPPSAEFSDEGDDSMMKKNTASKIHSRGAGRPTSQNKTPVLDNFGRDITRSPKRFTRPHCGPWKWNWKGFADIIRRKKNNPYWLVNPVWVKRYRWRTGLRIVQRKVSRVLFDKRVVSLDPCRPGSRYQNTAASLKERMKAIMNELEKTVMWFLFIDEIHTIVGAGGASGSLDASNIFKPALGKGELQCIGASTLDEYRMHIEKRRCTRPPVFRKWSWNSLRWKKPSRYSTILK